MRLKEDISSKGGLSENQFGFRQGRSTINAINKVLQIAKTANSGTHRTRQICAVVLLDVRNAFNSAVWQEVIDEIKVRRIEPYLQNIIRSYLHGRRIIIESEGTEEELEVTRGVPQGSVLGPTLWNLMYDGVLRVTLPEGATAIGFADDLALKIVARKEDEVVRKANRAIRLIIDWMEEKSLSIAPEKTEAVVLTTKRKLDPIIFTVKDVEVKPSGAVKYLGVWIDTKLNFAEHIKKTANRAEEVTAALSRLMPNVGGPRASKRRTMGCVAHSIMLYAAPVWNEALKIQRTRQRMERVQRQLAIRITGAYRTVSRQAVLVIAGVPPIDLMAAERTAVYNGEERGAARNQLYNSWQQMWEGSTKGIWTRQLIPNVKKWTLRKHGEIGYHLTQILTGHGCFQDYLLGIGKVESRECLYCGETDHAEHTMFQCPRWNPEREGVCRSLGLQLTPSNMIEVMLENEDKWKTVKGLADLIIATKERDERQQEERYGAEMHN